MAPSKKTARDILQQMADGCPKCRGTGKVKIWEAVCPVTKQATGWYRRTMNPETGEMEYDMKPCPHCGKAREYLAQPPGLLF